MPRPHTIAVLASTLALAFATTAVAIAQTGHSVPSRQAVAATAGTTTTIAATHVPRQSHHFRGNVTSADQGHHRFGIRTLSRSVRIYTTGATTWHGCDWSDMHAGHPIDVHAYRSHGHWVASSMQNWHHDDNDDSGHGDDMMR